MKIKILIPLFLLVIIAILGGALAYEIDKNQEILKRQQQTELTAWVQLYHHLDKGETAAAKRQLGDLVTSRLNTYLNQYGQAPDFDFVSMINEAKLIKAEGEAMGVTAK